jgi:trimethylamine---corrinoid protein Co-methyltransferase
MAMLAEASIIYGPGMHESGFTFDLAQLVIDNEIIAMTKYCRNGIAVNDMTTCIEEIIAAGPGSHFLDSPSTLAGMRGLSTTKLIDRQVREAWEAAGSPAFYENARKEARRLLQTHVVEPLPEEATRRIRAIVDAADADARVPV